MVDEVLARVKLFRHGSFRYVLESDVAVEIDHRRHNGLALHVNVHGSGRYPQLTSTADPGEQVMLDDECGIFDGCTAVARDEPRPFEDRHASRSSLATHPAGPAHRQEQTRHDGRAR